MFKEQHPRKQRSTIPVEEQRGRNAAPVAYPEDKWIHCSRCGFSMNKARAGKGHGDGISQSAGTYGRRTLGNNAATDSATPLTNVTDPTASSGCPFCGTFMYE